MRVSADRLPVRHPDRERGRQAGQAGQAPGRPASPAARRPPTTARRPTAPAAPPACASAPPRSRWPPAAGLRPAAAGPGGPPGGGLPLLGRAGGLDRRQLPIPSRDGRELGQPGRAELAGVRVLAEGRVHRQRLAPRLRAGGHPVPLAADLPQGGQLTRIQLLSCPPRVAGQRHSPTPAEPLRTASAQVRTSALEHATSGTSPGAAP